MAQGTFAQSRESEVFDSTGYTSKKRILSQEAQDKLIYDILSADQGLAQLVSGDGIVGGYGSSSKTLMAQDFITKALGELALVTAEEYTGTGTTSKKVNKKIGGSITGKASVICTELARQGKLERALYEAGHSHFASLSSYTVRGYHYWANAVVPLMQKSPRLSNLLAPIATGRYLMTTGRKKLTFWGAITIYIGQPICYLIGRTLVKEIPDGHPQSAT